MANRRIRVITNSVADHYSQKHKERTIEFNGLEDEQGGLINFYQQPDGRLRVQVYNLDKNVVVLVDETALLQPAIVVEGGRRLEIFRQIVNGSYQKSEHDMLLIVHMLDQGVIEIEGDRYKLTVAGRYLSEQLAKALP